MVTGPSSIQTQSYESGDMPRTAELHEMVRDRGLACPRGALVVAHQVIETIARRSVVMRNAQFILVLALLLGACPGGDAGGSPERDAGASGSPGAGGAGTAAADGGKAGDAAAADGGAAADAGMSDAGGPQAGSDAAAPQCMDGATRNLQCGDNGRGTLVQRCSSGRWTELSACQDPDVCVDSATRDRACGLNSAGTQPQLCEAGAWVDVGTCGDPDVCVNGDTRTVTCGTGGAGTQATHCSQGQWVNVGGCVTPCTEGSTRDIACGLNGAGTQHQICSSAQWQDDGACADPDVCVNGSTRTISCGIYNHGTQPESCQAGKWQISGLCNDPDATVAANSSGLCGGCAANAKICNGQCVSTTDPLNGCGGDACTACSPAHALPSCSGQGCAIAGCEPGWADCDLVAANGCEADLTSPTSCGTCGTSCPSGQLCSAGTCVDACTPPLSHCGNACVNLASNSENCGGCGTSCNFGSCSGGVCGAPASCPSGYTLCGTSCIDLTNSPFNCGACGQACTGGQTCSASTCVPAACPVGFTRCGSACVVVAADAANCGSCGHACNTGEVCTAGACGAPSTRQLASLLTAPFDLTLDDSHVYWTDTSAGTISAVPLAGGAVVPIASGQAKPLRVAVDATYAYWSNNLGGAIMRATKDGLGSPEVVVAITSPTSFAIAGDYVYVGGSSRIDRVLKSGGTLAPFATVTDSDTPTFSEIVADDTALYTIGHQVSAGTYVWRFALADGSSTRWSSASILSTGAAILPLQLDAMRVYFGNGYNMHHVDSVFGLDGSGLTSVNTAKPTTTSGYTDAFQAFAPSDCGVLWVSNGALYHQRIGTPYGAPLVSSGVQRVTYAHGIVYWTASDGTVDRMQLP